MNKISAGMRVNPHMLVMARESRGFTQTAFAREIGVTQATISKAEGDVAVPSDELLEKYATALHYPRAFFNETVESLNLPVTFYRKKAKLGAGAQKEIRARVNILRLHIYKMLQSIDPLPSRVPELKLEDFRNSPEEVARELRLQWQIKDGPIQNLTAIIEALGILVIAVDFGTDQIDGLSICDPRGEMPPIIFVSSTISGDRLRHTLGHELAHVILHHHRELPSVECEPEADRLAGELLAPARQIRGFLSKITLDRLVEVKRHWRVSIASLLIRCDQLNLLTPSRKTRLWQELSMRGWRKHEPIEIPREEPTMIERLLRLHLDDLHYTVDELAALIRCAKEDLPTLHRGVFGDTALHVVGAPAARLRILPPEDEDGGAA